MTYMQNTQMTASTTMKSPRRRKPQEEHGPKERNMKVFYKLNVKDNIDITTYKSVMKRSMTDL